MPLGFGSKSCKKNIAAVSLLAIGIVIMVYTTEFAKQGME